jgi:hypothetical protein
VEKEQAQKEDKRVEVYDGKKKRIIPWKRVQGWASLRKRMIHIFGLKRARWELQERRIGTPGDGGWTIVSPPLLPDAEREYRVIRRKITKKAPGPRGGTTHGKPKKVWPVGSQR